MNPRGLLEYQQRDEAQTEHYGTYAKEHGIVHRIAPRTYVAQNVAHEHPSADAADPANDLTSPQHSPAPPSWQRFGQHIEPRDAGDPVCDEKGEKDSHCDEQDQARLSIGPEAHTQGEQEQQRSTKGHDAHNEWLFALQARDRASREKLWEKPGAIDCPLDEPHDHLRPRQQGDKGWQDS